MRQEVTKLLFTETEAAEYLKISVSTLQKSRTTGSTKISNGIAPAFVRHLGGVRYRVDTLDQFKVDKGSRNFYTKKVSSCPIEQNEARPNTAPLEVKIEIGEDHFDWSSLVAPSNNRGVRL